MLVEYKTSLQNRGKNEDGDINWEGFSRIVEESKYCCEDMKTAVDSYIAVILNKRTHRMEMITDFLGHGEDAEIIHSDINFCSWCGEKIEYKEVERVMIHHEITQKMTDFVKSWEEKVPTEN